MAEKVNLSFLRELSYHLNAIDDLVNLPTFANDELDELGEIVDKYLYRIKDKISTEEKKRLAEYMQRFAIVPETPSPSGALAQ